jgi:hypothetical protein
VSGEKRSAFLLERGKDSRVKSVLAQGLRTA